MRDIYYELEVFYCKVYQVPTMPLTDEELRNQYYLSVIVYLNGYTAPYTNIDPATGAEWAFTLTDDGSPPHPNPQITSWGVTTFAQPTSIELMATVSMAMVDDARSYLYPAQLSPETKRSYEDRIAALEKSIRALGVTLETPTRGVPAPTRFDEKSRPPISGAFTISGGASSVVPDSGTQVKPTPRATTILQDDGGFTFVEKH